MIRETKIYLSEIYKPGYKARANWPERTALELIANYHALKIGEAVRYCVRTEAQRLGLWERALIEGRNKTEERKKDVSTTKKV